MKRKNSFSFFAMVLVGTFLSLPMMSCIRPYDKPTFEEVDTYETAFLIPMLSDGGDTSAEQMNGADYYKSKEVNSKLIQIPHQWIQTGRFRNSGYYRDTVKVVKVSLKPVSGTWDIDSGKVIRVETIGSQGIRVPLSFTAKILPEDAALFLSNYPSKALEEVLNNEFNRYTADILGKAFHKVAYEDVARRRDEILGEAYADITSHFKEQGITIVQMGIIDGLVYDDTSLQSNIDEQAKIESAKILAEKRQQLLEAERKNAEYEAQTQVNLTKIKAETYKLDMEQKRLAQEIENLRLKGEAEAARIRSNGFAPVPQVLIVQDLNALGNAPFIDGLKTTK